MMIDNNHFATHYYYQELRENIFFIKKNCWLYKLTISGDNLVAYKAKIAKKLMVVSFAVGKSFFLIMPVSEERFLALGAHEMLANKYTELISQRGKVRKYVSNLDVPVFSQGGDDAFFYGPAARSANRDSHLIVTPQTV